MIRLRAGCRLLFFMIRDIIHSSILLAWDVITPRDKFNVQLIRFQTACQNERELLALTILIGLSPGTMVIDVSDDSRTLLIHALYADNAQLILSSIQSDIERPLLQFTRGINHVHGA